MSSAPVEVPRSVAEAIERVRRSGETNMLDRPRVVTLLRRNGDWTAAHWGEADKSRYARLLFQEVRVID